MTTEFKPLQNDLLLRTARGLHLLRSNATYTDTQD